MKKFIIDDRIFTVKFSCDTSKCFGACCTLKGAGGAPLLDEEVIRMRRLLPSVMKHLDEKHRQFIKSNGFFEGRKGEYSIKSIDDKECAFVYYDNGIARCSFQKTYFEERNGFPKPISCHLFPIRITGSDRNILKYEEIYECHDALDKGELDGITIFEYLKEPLIREYGKEFYEGLKKRYMEDRTC